MDNTIQYFKYALLFPIIVMFVVYIVVISILGESEYYLVYNDGGDTILKSNLIWPTPRFRNISSYFGNRTSPTTGASTYHAGVDILAYQGTDVLSIDSGKVLFAGWSNSGGYMVKIQHSNGLQSSYCHMGEKIDVVKGEKVIKGQKIGTVGPKYLSNGQLNGATTGVHLHFAISENGKAVNPLKYY